jgi:hypothetical protein
VFGVVFLVGFERVRTSSDEFGVVFGVVFSGLSRSGGINTASKLNMKHVCVFVCVGVL